MDIVETADKGFITGGWGGDNNHCFLMKIDKKGDIVWSKQITEHNKQNGFFKKFIRLKDGNYIGVARSYRHSFTDTWMVKFDEDGNIIWSKEQTYPGGIGTDPFGITETSDGGLVIVGWYQPFPNFSGSLITKLDANGKWVWSRGRMGQVNLTDVLESKGVLLVAGADYENKNGVILKLNLTTGAVLETKSYVIENKRTAIYTIRENNNRFFINAYTYSSNVNNTTKQVILMLDMDLKLLSAQKFDFGFRSTWEYAAIAPIPEGGFIAGQADYYGETDVILYKVKQDGTVEWKRQFPKKGGDFLFSLKLASDEGLIGAGVSNNFGNYWNFQNDIFVIKTDALGLTSCSVVDPLLTVTNPTVTISTPTYDYQSMTFPIVDIISSTPSVIPPTVTRCEDIWQPTCNSFKVWGDKNVCSIGEVVVYKAVRNNNCKVPVSWKIDTEYATQITANDSTITVKFKKAGFAKIKCSINDPCQPLSDSLEVQVSNDPVTINLGQDKAICPNNTLTLTAGRGFASYQWHDGSSDSIFQVTQPGLFYVTATNRCGAQLSDTIVITSTPPIAFAVGPDRIKCNDDTIHLSAPAGFLNYVWSNNYNISATDARNVIVNPLVDTSYYVKAEKTLDCFVFDTIRITVHRSPSIHLGNARELCIGDSLMLDAGLGFQMYKWSNGEASQKTFIKSAGQFSVIGIAGNGCQTKDTVKVIVHPLPIIPLNKDTLACSGYGKELDAGIFEKYNWSTGASTRAILVNGLGKYAVTVTDERGCMNKDSVMINTLVPPPENFLPKDTAICSYGILTLRPNGAFSSYSWSDGTAASQIIINKPGTYSLQVKEEKGCIGIDSIVVSPKECKLGVFIPNVFTPNNDGKNDLFKATVFGPVKEFELVVYNRWGQEVFKTNDPARGWDGWVRGVAVQTNVYVWVCKYQIEGSPLQMDKGSITLIR
jgi:gliding motility-associated-like protein